MLLRLHFLLALVPLLSACEPMTPPAPEDTRKPVRVITAGGDDRAPLIRTTGLVASQEEARLGFKTGGVIAGMLVDAGDRVQRGQVLARLDDTELAAALRQATAQHDKAVRDLQRAETLFRQGVLAEQAVQDARTQLAMTEAAQASARFNRQQAVIVAPGPGIVLQRLADAREVAAPGAPVLVVSRDDLGWTLKAGLGEQAAIRVRKGDAAEIVLSAYPDRTLASRVQDIAGAIDRQTGTTTITMPLTPAPDMPLRAGMIGEAWLRTARPSDGELVLPLGAVLEANGRQAHVFVLTPEQVVGRRQVTLGDLREDRVVIRDGLRAGERVVSEGAAWLNAGDPVRVLR